MESMDLGLGDVLGNDNTPGESNTMPKVPMEGLDRGNHEDRLIVEMSKEGSLTTVKRPYQTESDNGSTESQRIVEHSTVRSYQVVTSGSTEVKIPYNMGGNNVMHEELGYSQTPLKEVVINGHRSDPGQDTHPKRPYAEPQGAEHPGLGPETHPKQPYPQAEEFDHSNSRPETKRVHIAMGPEEGSSQLRDNWVSFPDDPNGSLRVPEFSELPSPPPSYRNCLPTDIGQNGYDIVGGATEHYSQSESHTDPKQRASTSAEPIGRDSAPPPTALALIGAPRSLVGQDSETTQVKIVHEGITEPGGSSDTDRVRWQTFDVENGDSGPAAGIFNQTPSLPPYNDLPSDLRQDPKPIESSRLAEQVSGNESLQTHPKERVTGSSPRQGRLAETVNDQPVEGDITNTRNTQIIEESEPSIDHRNTEDITISGPPSYNQAEVRNPDDHWVTENPNADDHVRMNETLNGLDNDTEGLIDEDYGNCGAPKWAIAVTVVLSLAIVSSVIIVLVYFLK